MDYKNQIAELLKGDFTAEEINNLITIADIKNGDFALPCFKLAAKAKKPPAVLAAELKAKIEKASPDFLNKAEVVGGYLNLWLNRESFSASTLFEVQKRGAEFASKPQNNKTITIDYSSINIAKDFHIGHLLTTVIGGSLCRIFRFLGYKVVGINHLGDWGTQFGKLIAAYKRWGGENTMESLTALYVRFHKECESDPTLEDEGRRWFKKIEDGDKDALKCFEMFKEVTLKEVSKTYDLLGVEFDSYNGESFFNDKMQPVIDLLEQKGLLEESEGAKVVNLEKYSMPPCLILKSDGATLYATRDLAAALYRKQTYDFDRNLYVVAYQQNLHFKQIFKVLELLGFDWANDCVHVPFGMVSIEGMGALSTRKGNVIRLKDVLNTAIEKTRAIIDAKNPDLANKDESAKEIGVGAVVFYALYNSRIKDVVFSYDKALSFDGETGPYLQYTHARCCSVLEKAGEHKASNKVDFSQLNDDESFEVVRILSGFDAAVEEAAQTYEPSAISRYLMNLAQSYNKFYINHRILGEDEKISTPRLLLTECVRNTLKNGLRLILLKAPAKM